MTICCPPDGGLGGGLMLRAAPEGAAGGAGAISVRLYLEARYCCMLYSSVADSARFHIAYSRTPKLLVSSPHPELIITCPGPCSPLQQNGPMYGSWRKPLTTLIATLVLNCVEHL